MTAVDDRWAWIDAGQPGDDWEPDDGQPADDDPDDWADGDYWQLPAGHHLVTLRSGACRIAVDLPDIANYQDRSNT